MEVIPARTLPLDALTWKKSDPELAKQERKGKTYILDDDRTCLAVAGAVSTGSVELAEVLDGEAVDGDAIESQLGL